MKKKEASATFGVIGLGRFGSALVEGLSKAEKEVIAVDRNESRVREARRFTDFAMAVKNPLYSGLFAGIQGIFLCYRLSAAVIRRPRAPDHSGANLTEAAECMDRY